MDTSGMHPKNKKAVAGREKTVEQLPQPQHKPIPRRKLILSIILGVPLFMLILIVFATIELGCIFRAQMQVVQTGNQEDGFDNPLSGLPPIPSYLRAATDGSLWARTRMWGSLSRYQHGKWDVFRASDFGTRRNSPEHDFAVVGNQIWAAIDGALVHFNGTRWQKNTIPVGAQDYLVAASQQGALGFVLPTQSPFVVK